MVPGRLIGRPGGWGGGQLHVHIRARRAFPVLEHETPGHVDGYPAFQGDATSPFHLAALAFGRFATFRPSWAIRRRISGPFTRKSAHTPSHALNARSSWAPDTRCACQGVLAGF